MKETTLLETYFMMGKCGENSLLSGALHLLTDSFISMWFSYQQSKKEEKKRKRKKKKLGALERPVWANLNTFFFFFFLPCRRACRVLVLWLGVEPEPSAVRAQNPNHQGIPWTLFKSELGKSAGLTWEYMLFNIEYFLSYSTHKLNASLNLMVKL